MAPEQIEALTLQDEMEDLRPIPVEETTLIQGRDHKGNCSDWYISPESQLLHFLRSNVDDFVTPKDLRESMI